MRIAIAGGHGQIALHLEKLLSNAGHEPIGIIRNPDHAPELVASGASALVLDLEQSTADELTAHLEGVDAVVFAAGAGPGSTAERKLTVDRDGAILLAEAASLAGVGRYVLLSSIGADDFDPGSDDVFQIYLRAKSEADASVRSTELDWSILRPGSLTDDAPTGMVTAAESVERGEIPRADVAAVIAELLTSGGGSRVQFELVGGSTPISEAVARLR